MFGSAYAQSNLPACQGTNPLLWNICTGTTTWPNGQRYVGEWKNGESSGHGTVTYGEGPFKGDTYTGQFLNNNFSGQGTYIKVDGEKYVGEFKDNERSGQGENSWVNGEKYVGQWRSNKRNGQGSSNFPNGDKFVGEYKEDKRNGHGIYTYRNGDKYVGDSIDNKANGQGAIYFADGKKYVGGFKDDKYHMQGTEYASNGSITRQGIWTNGFLTTSAPVPQVTASSAQPINSERDRLTAEFAAEIKKREELERQLAEANRRKKILSELDSLLRR